MPDKKINELPTLTDEQLNDNARLWVTGDPETGTLYQVTIQQLKSLIQTNWTSVLAASFVSIGGIGGNTTTYGQMTGKAGAYGNEISNQFVITEDCKAHNFFAVTTGAQPAGGDLVITLRKNGASTPVTITIAANAAGGVFSDVAHEIDIVAGDVLAWQIVNGSNLQSASFALSVSLTKTS